MVNHVQVKFGGKIPMLCRNLLPEGHSHSLVTWILSVQSDSFGVMLWLAGGLGGRGGGRVEIWKILIMLLLS